MKVEREIEIDTTIAATKTVITNNNNSNSSGNSGNSSNSNNSNSNNNHQHINSNSNSPSSFASSFEFVRFPRAMPTGHSRAAASSASDPPPQSRSGVQRGHVVLPSEEDFERAEAYYRGRWDQEQEAAVAAAVYQRNCMRCDALGAGVRLDHGGQVIERDPVCAACGAFAADGAGPLPKKVRRWGHEQAAVAAAASGSSVAGAAEEPLLSDNVPMLWPPDVEDVPLPTTFKRMRTEDSEKTVWDPLALHRWHDKRQKVESSAVAGKESPAVADNGRTPGLQISGCMFLMEVREREAEEWVRGSCCMVPMESRQKEDAEVSSEATTLHLGSPAKSRYVCPGGSSCENMDCPCDWPETQAEDVNEDVNAIARDLQTLHDTAQRWRDLAQEWKEAKDPKLGKVKGNGRSGGSAAPKQDRKAKGKKKGKEEEPCICENCMSWEEYKLFIKAKEKEKAEDKKRGKDKDLGKGKESSAVADKGQHELKRETAKETHTRPS